MTTLTGDACPSCGYAFVVFDRGACPRCYYGNSYRKYQSADQTPWIYSTVSRRAALYAGWALLALVSAEAAFDLFVAYFGVH